MCAMLVQHYSITTHRLIVWYCFTNIYMYSVCTYIYNYVYVYILKLSTYFYTMTLSDLINRTYCTILYHEPHIIYILYSKLLLLTRGEKSHFFQMKPSTCWSRGGCRSTDGGQGLLGTAFFLRARVASSHEKKGDLWDI